MMNPVRKKEKGFIALTSVLIIGAVVLVLGISLFHSALTDYSISTAYESGQKAAFLADFCLKEGMFKLQEDINYIGGEEINVNNATCTINFVKQIDENTKEISSLGRAGDQPHFSRVSRLVRYIIESSEADWKNGTSTKLEIVGDYLKLQRAEARVIARITDLSDEWNNYFATSNVEITEDGSLVLSVIPTPAPTCVGTGGGTCKANACSSYTSCSLAVGGNYDCFGATPYCCSGTCSTPPICGDNICSGGENLYTCPEDCFHCLIADTLILTPSGYKKIQDLNVEDEVIGFDIENNERVATEVKTKSIHTGLFPAWVYNDITFTWNHKVYVNNQWQYVADLAEKVVVFEGTVYNITTQTQNYFAKYGDSGIETLVHNKPIPY